MTIGWYPQSRPLKDGRRNLQIRIDDGRHYHKFLNLKLFVHIEYWDKEKRLLSEKHPQATELNEKIIHYNTKIDKAVNLSIAGMSREQVVASIRSTSDNKTLEDFIKDVLETKRNKGISDTQLTNQITFYKLFKKILGISRPLEWKDINNSLYEPYYAKMEPKLRAGEISKRTYKNYASAPIWIINRAIEYEVIPEEYKKPILRKYRSAPQTSGKKIPKKAIEPNTMLQAIKSSNTIERLQACGIWLLEFGLRGIGNSDLLRLSESILRNKKDLEVSRKLDALSKEIYFDYGRSKTGASMFIRLFPDVITVLEKLKYTIIYTHAGTKILGEDIVTGMNDRYSILKYDSKTAVQKHNQLFRNRSNKFKDLGLDIDFASARRTFMQLAKRTTNFNTGLVKILIGETGDKMLQDHYDNYKSIEEIERVEQEHLKVLEEFNYNRLVDEFVVKLKQIVEDTEAPRWLLKQSAVHTDEKGLKVLVGFEKRKPVWEYIPAKFKKYFNDPTMQEGYWIEEQTGEKLLTQSERIKQANVSKWDLQRVKEYIQTIKEQEEKINKIVERVIKREKANMDKVKEILEKN